ncbi:DUF6506 family protein [Streptomyces jumonjinensis]|uniref:Uncharacterized protein n=1 Tax=Streptomyces jumonjinensis TaxID=1945 RepID=A0A646K9P0_STRJU|nr:DUF6506 family protein [Streptomyces jumonjinensis]MQS98827.1 hypothetical protein [Streptomyces jumonjinensis]
MTGDSAIIYAGETAQPVRMGRTGAGTVIGAAPSVEAAARLAARLAGEGVGTIQLCGATGLVWTAAVERAVGGRARVATVLFGFESLIQVARFKELVIAGRPVTMLFLCLQEGADPAVDRLERQEGAVRALFVAVPDPGAGAAVAAGLAGEVELIELYGGFAPNAAAAVIEAAGERVAVGAAMSPAAQRE